MAFKIALIVTFLVASAYSQSNNYLQQARLYTVANGGGSSLLVNQQKLNTLTQHGFDKVARSVHATGIWLFYEDQNFNQNRDAGIEYVIGFAPSGLLANLNYLSGQVRSARYVGAPSDYRVSTFTLYEYTWFQGREHGSAYGSPDVTIPTSGSLILTGKDAWTVYDLPNYKGHAQCIYPPSGSSSDYTPGMLVDTEEKPWYIPHGSIRSFKKGCWAKAGAVAAGVETDEVPQVRLEVPAAEVQGSNAGAAYTFNNQRRASPKFFAGAVTRATELPKVYNSKVDAVEGGQLKVTSDNPIQPEVAAASAATEDPPAGEVYENKSPVTKGSFVATGYTDRVSR